MIETIRPAGAWREDAVTKARGEDLAAAEDRITDGPIVSLPAVTA